VTAFVLAAYAANINPLPVLRKQHRTARYICDEKEAVVLRRDEWRIDIYRDDEIAAVVVVSDPTALWVVRISPPAYEAGVTVWEAVRASSAAEAEASAEGATLEAGPFQDNDPELDRWV